MLKAFNLTKKYKDGSRDIYALKNFSYTFPKRGMVAVLGASGSGKSTLLNLLSLNEKPSEGTIFYNGVPLNELKEKEIDEYHNLKTGFLYQKFHLLENENVFHNIALPSLIAGNSYFETEKKVKRLLEEVQLKNKERQVVRTLSGGEKQRVAFLRAIINHPRVLFSDEPTGSLDQKNGQIIFSYLRKISQKILVIFVTHDQKNASTYGDALLYLQNGKLEKVMQK